MTLHLIRLGVDPLALTRFAVERRFGDDDDGYALHCALVARFGDAAPRPFRYLPDHGRGPHLLCYATDWAAMQEAAALPALDDRLDSLFGLPQAQPMPDAWRTGARYAFEVRARPVVRFGKSIRAARQDRADAWQRRAGEVDAYVAACERAMQDSGTTADVTREAVYGGWLRARLEGAATLDEVSLRLFRRTRARRSTHGAAGSARTRAVEGPDAVLAGTLTVSDPAAFAMRLARGIGRHAAFGHGMLLLSPAGRAA